MSNGNGLQRFLYIIIDAFLLFLEAHSSIFVRFWRVRARAANPMNWKAVQGSILSSCHWVIMGGAARREVVQNLRIGWRLERGVGK